MKSRKKIHLQIFLFRSYMGAMLLVTLIVLLSFFAYQFSTLNQSIRDSIQQANQTVAQSVDNQIRQMDTVALSALYSNLLKDSFSSYSSLYAGEEPSPADTSGRVSNAKVLHDLLFAIIGVNSDVRQVNLYNMDQGGFGTGWYNGYLSENLTELPWYARTISLEGMRHVTPPYKSEFLTSASQSRQERYYISLCRMYYNQFNKMDGAIEVVQYADVVFQQVNSNDSLYHPAFYIYDGAGVLVYPAEASPSLDYFRAYAKDKPVATLKSKSSGVSGYVCFEELPYSGFLSVAVVAPSAYLPPILQLAGLMLVLLAGLVFACYLTANKLTRRLAVPFKAIHTHLSEIDINTLSFQELAPGTSNIVEMENLNQSINLFQSKLKNSMDNILLLQQQEAQSQILALQSQMNPHFLYNSLATIQAMAQAGMNDGIVEMSTAMTDILRYISSNKDSMVRLEIELENTELYLHCLKPRYEDNLHFCFEVADSMLGVMVPKLCVQLLVENAIKYATVSAMPPWTITVCCEESECRWLVTVSDNGGGFSRNAIAEINDKIRQIDKTNMLPSLELQGMGLMNLYIRLRLLFAEDYVFRFGNREGGGAYVQIGGRKHG